MRRVAAIVVVGALVLAFATIVAARATHTKYTSEGLTYFMGDPFDYITRAAGKWLFLEDLPLGGVYARTLEDGTLEQGFKEILVSGKVSDDFADGSFHGTTSIEIRGMTCAGRFQAKRVDYFEQGSMVLQCPDGSKFHEMFQFPADPTASEWIVYGMGTILDPHG